MHIIRPIHKDDSEAYFQFAFAARLGMTSMPKNKDLLMQNINASLDSFSKSKPNASNFYLFVIEDLLTKKIGGVCGIYSQIGLDFPYYYYQEEIEYPLSYKDFPLPTENRVLKAIQINQGPSEICSLYLFPDFRKEGLGKLLSLSRFLFIASFQDHFQEEIIAEMRGYIDENNYSPFWQSLGRHFLNLDYSEVQQIKDTNKEFIPFILPKYPIYVDLLPKEAQEMIGNVHENTRPALRMLENEGFKMTNYFDVFDAGPVIKAEKKNIRMIKDSSKQKVIEISDRSFESNRCIASNGKLAFRACYSDIKEVSEGVIIPKEVAISLEIAIGDSITFAKI